MNLAATFRHMPEPAGAKYKRAAFRTSAGRVYSLLAEEIRRLGGNQPVIEAGFRDDQIRNDGWPYSSARPSHPAVRVSFTSATQGALSFECSTYDTVDDNLHAIAKTMERLRDIARYGAVKGGQQYKGWKQLPGQAPTQYTTTDPNVELRMAAACLCKLAGEQQTSIPGVIANRAVLQSVYRKASMNAHPDRGGSESIMTMANKARDLIEKHQGAAR